jgi:hypothetical protein
MQFQQSLTRAAYVIKDLTTRCDPLTRLLALAPGRGLVGRTGRAWMPSRVERVITLDTGLARFRGDDGSADQAVATALTAFGAGQGTEHAALTALAGSRLLVPVVATASAAGPHSDMSVPMLIGRDSRPAIPAFTCLDALARWRPDARPVPEEAGRVWRAAAAASAAVVIDIAGPVPLPVDGARLAALAAGRAVPLPHQDPDVLAAVRAAADGREAIAGVGIAAGQDGGDLVIRVTLATGCTRTASEQAIRQLGAALMAELGARLRRGISIAAAAPGASDAAAGDPGANDPAGAPGGGDPGAGNGGG